MSYIKHAKKIWKVKDLHGIARKQLALNVRQLDGGSNALSV